MASTKTETSPPPYTASTNTIQPSHTVTVSPNGNATTVSAKENSSAQLRTYKTAIPPHLIRSYAVPADCPICGQRALTRLKYVVRGVTHILGATLFLCSGVLFWIPYMFKSMKNVHHYCGNPECGVLLATWHRAPTPGWIEIKQFS